MKRKSSRKSVGKSDEGENGVEVDEEAYSSEVEEPQEKKGRKSKGRKSKQAKAAETESDAELDDEANEAETLKQNGNDQEKKTPKSKGKKAKHGKKEDAKLGTESTEEADPLGGDSDAEYEVEGIMDDKMVAGVRHYLIRWKGYTEESDTWEPEDTLDCDSLIKEYNQKTKKSKPGRKQGKKGKKTDEPEETWDENEDFEVDRILDVYFHRNGKKDFLVSWKGYPSSQNSWEPEDNMDCKDLIEKFMMKVANARKFDSKELRVNRKPVNRLTFSTPEHGRRLSRRVSGKERVHYFDAE